MILLKKLSILFQLISIFLLGIIEANGQKLESSTFHHDSSCTHDSGSNLNSKKVDSIISLGKNFIGKPYRYKLNDGKVLDCSGFINFIYGQNDVDLPRSTSSLASVSEKICLSDTKKGDLLFFKGRNINSVELGHVSMVTSVDSDTIEMMHSCNRGIIIEKYNSNKYYTSRFLFAGRLPQLTSKDTLVLESIPIDSDTTKIDSNLNGSIIKPDSIFKEKSSSGKQPKSVKIIGVGDIMLGTNFPNSSYLPPNDGRDILNHVKPIISKGDVSFGNLEGVLLSNGGTVKKCSNPKNCYAFRMPDHYVNYLSEAGFNLLSVANNHARDFGSLGAANTMKVLREAGISHAGLEECPFTTFRKKGVTYGFAAFAPNSGTIKINDYRNARKIISQLDTVCDIVIVSFHGGAEGSTKNHITRERELFLGEDRGNPYEFARMAIDAGADIIFGHGPHVTRAIDIYKDRFISYSLGNFATYGRFNLSGPNGVSPIIELDVDSNGKFIKGKIHSIMQTGGGKPVIDNNYRALKEIIELTNVDIVEFNLSIDNDGILSRKHE